MPPRTRTADLLGHNVRRAALILTATFLLLGACKVRLVDDYNKDAEDGLLRTYGRVENLFDAIAERAEDQRRYHHFSDRYSEINGMIRVQVLRESARPLNRESFGIISEIDTVFMRFRDRHRSDDNYPEALLQLHRPRMQRMFGAALRAERVRRDDSN